MNYSILRNRRGYLFHSFMIMAFLLSFPSLSSAAACGEPDTCVVTMGYNTEYAGPSGLYEQTFTLVDDSCLSIIKHQAPTVTPDVAPYYITTVWKYFWNPDTSTWNQVNYQNGTQSAVDYGGTLTHESATFVSPSTIWPNGCSDLPSNDPCENYETEIDYDGDGICDRCDLNPQDKDEGQYVWLMMNHSFEGTLIAQQYSIVPPDVFMNLPSAIAKNYLYTASQGDPNSDLDLTGTDMDLVFEFDPSAEMQPCACDTPCTLSTLPGTAMTAGDYEFTGTSMTPETPPEIILPGSTLPRNFILGDPRGLYGTTSSGTAAPVSGTDNELLQSIAGNQSTTASNLGIVGDILDAELNDLNANTARTAGNAAETNELLKGQLEDDTLTSSDTTSLLDSATSELTTLGDGLIDSITADITEQATNSDFTESLFDGVLEEFTGIFSSGECSDLSYYIPSLDRTVTLSCDFSVKFKTLFGFMVAIYTIMELINILFTGIVPKGTPNMSLWGN